LLAGRRESPNLRTASLPVESLVDKIGRREILLPEIQRAYVWKPTQVAGLVDSLYRRYPSGSLLMWETDLLIENREVASAASSAPANKPLYLLDGQQRLTSLHRVFSGHPEAVVVFNVESERFQIRNAATSKDPRFIPVQPVLAGTASAFSLTGELASKLPGLSADEINARLQRLQKIRDYNYHLEIIEGLPYEEVTQIFVRVNSRGRSLKTTDLALATLSARWPGVVERFEKLAARCVGDGYADLDTAFLVRAFAAQVDNNADPAGFATADVESFEQGWNRLDHALSWLVQLLRDDVGITTSSLIPSINALVPAVTYLSRKTDKLTDEQRRGLLYWLFGAWLNGRYSYSAQSTITQDVKALDSADPIAALWKNLGLVGELEVTAGDLAGKGAGSAYFMLSYLACCRETPSKPAARDWWHMTPVTLKGTGAFKVEYHHIHPRATLKAQYTKAEINDLANLAFISAKANRKISDRSPADYFVELSETELVSHLVPQETDLRTAPAYPQFAAARRAFLAAAMTELLAQYRPTFVSGPAIAHEAPSVGITGYGSLDDPESLVLDIVADVQGTRSRSRIGVSALTRALDDVDAGLGTEIIVDGVAVEIPPGIEVLEIPTGAVRLHGTIDEWREVLQRELTELRPFEDMPAAEPGVAFDGEPVPVHITETD